MPQNQKGQPSPAAAHLRLLQMIRKHQPTFEEAALLQKIKIKTTADIGLKYLQSEPNRLYAFPLLPQEGHTREEEEEAGRLARKELVVYDLHSQNKLAKIQNIRPREIFAPRATSRPHSLDQAAPKPTHQSHKARLNLKNKHNLSLKKLNRAASKERVKTESVRLAPIRSQQRLKLATEGAENEEEDELVRRKLHTQQASPLHRARVKIPELALRGVQLGRVLPLPFH